MFRVPPSEPLVFRGRTQEALTLRLRSRVANSLPRLM